MNHEEEELDYELDSEEMKPGDEPDTSGPEWEDSDEENPEYVSRENDMVKFAEGLNRMWAEQGSMGKLQPVSDYAELVALLAGTRPGYVKNEDRIQVYTRACKLADEIVKGTSSYQQRPSFDMFGSIGRITIECASVTIANVRKLCELAELADEMKIYPTVSGKACISLGFFELYNLTPDATMIPSAAIALRDDRRGPARVRARRAKSLIKRGKRDERLVVLCDKDNRVSIGGKSVCIDDTWSFAIAANSANGMKIETTDDGMARIVLEYRDGEGDRHG